MGDLMSPELINAYRVIPRLMVAGYGALIWTVSSWFMTLPDPTGPQAAFVSTLVGASAGVFGFYVNSGNAKP